MNNQKNIVPAVKKAIAIIDFIENSAEGVTLNIISDFLSLPKTSCFRILHTLCVYGYLEYNRISGCYTLGMRLAALGKSVQKEFKWMEQVEEKLQEFAMHEHETIKASILEGGRVVIIAKAESDNPMRISISKGSGFPLHAGAACKVLLGSLPDEDLHEIIPHSLKQFTPDTITDKETLIKIIKTVREEGFAIEHEEFIQGISAVAVGVRLPDSRMGALSVPFFTQAKSKDDINALVASLQLFSKKIESYLEKGY